MRISGKQVLVRSYGTNEWVVGFCHYIPTLMKKPAAIEYGEMFHQMSQKMQDIFGSHFKDNWVSYERDAI